MCATSARVIPVKHAAIPLSARSALGNRSVRFIQSLSCRTECVRERSDATHAVEGPCVFAMALNGAADDLSWIESYSHDRLWDKLLLQVNSSGTPLHPSSQSRPSPSRKIPSPDSPSSQTLRHQSRTQSSLPLSSPAETCPHESESSSPTRARPPQRVLAPRTPPQKSWVHNKSHALPLFSDLPRQYSSRARSNPRQPQRNYELRSTPSHARPLYAARGAPPRRWHAIHPS